MPWIKVRIGFHHCNGRTYRPGESFFTDNEDFVYQHGDEKFVELEEPPPEAVEVEPVTVADVEEQPVTAQVVTRPKSKHRRR